MQKKPTKKRKKPWFEKLTREQRIELAKSKMIRIVDHFLYLIELHANNSYVVYSSTLSSQIPTSFAASAFNVFQRSMYQIEIVRLCALWDSVDPEKENIPTVIALIDDDAIIEALAEQTRSFWADHVGGIILNPSDDVELAKLEQEALKQSNIQYGAEQASSAKTQLREAISDVRAVLGSAELSSLMNVRDKPYCSLPHCNASRKAWTSPANENWRRNHSHETFNSDNRTPLLLDKRDRFFD